jgi:PPK2 family polyphosphate:nucleotide phosphotransferase
MSPRVERFKVEPGTSVELSKLPTRVEPIYDSKKHYRGLLKDRVKELSKLQTKLYAADTHAVLLIFQAMDTGGKDSCIRHVMSGVNPQGCQVYSFSHPSEQDLDHDFLWRTTQGLPERGRIGIFNRSYYEEVLIVRVHREILYAERLPEEALEDHSIWDKRYRSIRDHEWHLAVNGTRVVKFFLHISKEEQIKRLLERIDTPSKRWKFRAGDITERAHWDEYTHAYEQALSATSTAEAPWYVIPADDQRNARLFVSEVVVRTIEAMDPQFPELPPEQERELEVIRERLLKEKQAKQAT